MKQKKEIYQLGQYQKSRMTLRKCIVTGESREPVKMIRFVLGPFGEVVPDIEEKLPGKGMWVTSCSLFSDSVGPCGGFLQKNGFTSSSSHDVEALRQRAVGDEACTFLYTDHVPRAIEV